ncbi:hypothetical protein OPQ81_004253 [Rhizoctonia solani]|nr:hypothetical protein OPQ81_004253 [Rhizoctonia solani]
MSNYFVECAAEPFERNMSSHWEEARGGGVRLHRDMTRGALIPTVGWFDSFCGRIEDIVLTVHHIAFKGD